MLKTLVLAFACAAFAQTPQLQVTPSRAMQDEVAIVRASGLTPGERIAIHAELLDGGEHGWASQSEFVADAAGVVDTSKQAPVAGSYKELSAMGFLWSMLPVDKDVAGYQPPKNFAPQSIELKLLRKNEAVASAQFEQTEIAEGVEHVTIHEGALRGVLFLPATKEPRPGILVLGGSEGGVPTRRAAWLASHGYAALALAYFHYEDLPPRLEDIPLEYFQTAIGWMRKRPEIVADRLAVMGGSRGGELALQLGAMFPALRAVVAYVPANLRVRACCGDNRNPWVWTWQGQPLAFVMSPERPRPDMAMRAEIGVEFTHGPILMISGGEDHVWDSAHMADAVVSRLKAHHFAFEFENLKYPHAGHIAGNSAIQPAWRGATRHPISGRESGVGGSVAGNAESSIDAIPKVLEFLKRALP